ncbi:unnamed protein product [Leptosia nina]|uniref:Uncharacterized protein n=1 Tax=Leptosia nina TaxID=320188 RepID=A0AAV1J857_9NEOP
MHQETVCACVRPSTGVRGAEGRKAGAKSGGERNVTSNNVTIILLNVKASSAEGRVAFNNTTLPVELKLACVARESSNDQHGYAK